MQFQISSMFQLNEVQQSDNSEAKRKEKEIMTEFATYLQNLNSSKT